MRTIDCKLAQESREIALRRVVPDRGRRFAEPAHVVRNRGVLPGEACELRVPHAAIGDTSMKEDKRIPDSRPLIAKLPVLDKDGTDLGLNRACHSSSAAAVYLRTELLPFLK